MPIYLDRHDASEDITAEHVAQMHQMDIKHQSKFGCKGFTYWFDDKRKAAFCLIEAPDRESIEKMHALAHGDVPAKIIEVNEQLVDSFLGRLEDPEKPDGNELNIISEPAFRVLMVVGLKKSSLSDIYKKQNIQSFQEFKNSVINIISPFNAGIVSQKSNFFLLSFDSVSNAILCALEIQTGFNKQVNENLLWRVKLKIGLSCGVAVTDKENIFEDSINQAERLCAIAMGKIVVSSEVKDLYQSENSNIFIDRKCINALNPSEEQFLNSLMDYTNKTWRNTDFKVDDFSKNLGLSKSQVYRKVKSLTGISPNTFIKEFRLNKALILLNKQEGNISEIAFDTGFNSPAYFSKCFQDRYKILPSSYSKMIENPITA